MIRLRYKDNVRTVKCINFTDLNLLTNMDQIIKFCSPIILEFSTKFMITRKFIFDWKKKKIIDQQNLPNLEIT